MTDSREFPFCGGRTKNSKLKRMGLEDHIMYEYVRCTKCGRERKLYDELSCPNGCNADQNYTEYRKKQTQLLRPYIDGEDMSGVSISDADKANGSPKKGDMIAINRNDETDKWLVAEKFFKENYEEAN